MPCGYPEEHYRLCGSLPALPALFFLYSSSIVLNGSPVPFSELTAIYLFSRLACSLAGSDFCMLRFCFSATFAISFVLCECPRWYCISMQGDIFLSGMCTAPIKSNQYISLYFSLSPFIVIFINPNPFSVSGRARINFHEVINPYLFRPRFCTAPHLTLFVPQKIG